MPDEQQTQPDETLYTEAEAELRRSRIPVVTPAGESAGMLPGIAGICLYLLLVTMVNAYSAATGAFGNGTAKYSILVVATLLVIGVFGLLRLLRWGWALVTAATLVMAFGYFYGFHRAHLPAYIVQGLFALCFFLYLSRTEVRDRLK
jgi:hypothetical protein